MAMAATRSRLARLKTVPPTKAYTRFVVLAPPRFLKKLSALAVSLRPNVTPIRTAQSMMPQT